MSTIESYSHKMNGEDEGPAKEYMHYCGTASFREEDRKEVKDGLNGTLTLRDGDVSAIGANPGSKIRILAEADGRSITTERKIHSNGRSVTIPTGKRRDLGVSAGDELEWWIDLVERHPDNDESSSSSSTSTTSKDTGDEMEHKCLWFVGETEFHYIDDENAEETHCGIELADRDYRIESEEPTGFLTACSDCDVRSSSEMTNEEIVEWFAAEAGFDMGGDPPSYLSKEQLVILRDWALDLKERADE